MADLSCPSEAAAWAASWLDDARHPRHAYQSSPDMILHRTDRARARIQAEIDRLSKTQPQRCAAGITAMRTILLATEVK